MKACNIVFRPLFYAHYNRFSQAANSIKFLENLDRLEHLVSIHLRDNVIERLDGFSSSMKNVQYLNFR